ncbi:MAG: phosphatase PAP2 family protein, partial [Ginsengibacter sp.]
CKPLDYIFRAFTILGDGLFIIGLAVILFIFRKRFLSLMIIAAYGLSGIPVQIIKSFFDAPRPALFLKGLNYSHFVEGVTLHNYNSFPSGHTASAFALAVILAVGVKNKRYGLLFLCLAALVGYSRIYLSQHFMEDVLVGSLIGVLTGVATYLFLEKWIRKMTEKEKSG